MITILNRLFPIDISKTIYNFIIQDYIKYILFGKLLTNSLIMEKHYNNFNTIVNKKMIHYDISVNYSEILNVCKFLKYIKTHFIEKKYYSYDIDMICLIQNFKKIIFYIGENENNCLIKNYFKLIYNEF